MVQIHLFRFFHSKSHFTIKSVHLDRNKSRFILIQKYKNFISFNTVVTIRWDPLYTSKYWSTVTVCSCFSSDMHLFGIRRDFYHLNLITARDNFCNAYFSIYSVGKMVVLASPLERSSPCLHSQLGTQSYPKSNCSLQFTFHYHGNHLAWCSPKDYQNILFFKI